MRSTYGKQLKAGYAVLHLEDNPRYLLYASGPTVHGTKCLETKIEAGDELIEWATSILGPSEGYPKSCWWFKNHTLGLWRDIAVQLERQ